MKIIVVGADGTGKTTLCKNLAEQAGYDYIHSSHIHKNKLKRTRRLLEKQRVVFDRFHMPAHFVYILLDKYDISNTEFLEWVDIILDMVGRQDILMIHLDSPSDILEARILERGDDNITADQVRTLQKGYNIVIRILEGLGMPVMKIETKDGKYYFKEGVHNVKSFR